MCDASKSANAIVNGICSLFTKMHAGDFQLLLINSDF